MPMMQNILLVNTNQNFSVIVRALFGTFLELFKEKEPKRKLL